MAAWISKIKDFLFFLVRPNYWLMNSPYCRGWDKKLNKLMEEHQFEIMSGSLYAKLGGHRVWITNHPYNSFTLDDNHCRPSRKTIYHAMQKLKREALDNFNGCSRGCDYCDPMNL